MNVPPNIDEITDIEALRKACRAYKRQMEVNNHYAELYERKLNEIGVLSGIKVLQYPPNCVGAPIDIEDEIVNRVSNLRSVLTEAMGETNPIIIEGKHGGYTRIDRPLTQEEKDWVNSGDWRILTRDEVKEKGWENELQHL